MDVSKLIDPLESFLGRTLPPPEQTNGNGKGLATRSVDGLGALASAYSWGAVLELANSLLADHEDALEEQKRVEVDTRKSDLRPQIMKPHERLLCDAYRGLALVQTRMLDRAIAILNGLGDLSPENPVYRYESHADDYPGHAPGSFVPFELLHLSVEVRIRQGDARAIADCYKLKSLFPQHEPLLLSSLAGYHLRAQQHDSAVDVARQLVLCEETSSESLYVYARVLLHVGDFFEARRVLSQADAHPDTAEDMRHVHRALLLVSEGEYAEALKENDAALELPNCRKHLRVYADSNAAICMMHLGLLSGAISRLENRLRQDPETALDEGLVFNLCTMYELAFPDCAQEKKKTLQKLAARFGRQGFNMDSIGTS